jgi:hypothetical protein
MLLFLLYASVDPALGKVEMVSLGRANRRYEVEFKRTHLDGCLADRQ